MSERPSLNQIKDGKTLREYYFLKEEPVGFCRENGLPTTGGKLKLTERIAVFLDSGEIKQASSAALGFIRAEIEKNQDFFRGLFGNFAFLNISHRIISDFWRISRNFPAYPQKSRLFRAAFLQKIRVISRLCFHSRK
ncbi:MAG TPA: hypothetical protein DEQ68_07650 [Ruminococcaceae bacterium]|nr:hypothetical protein [Oscillospiraceae bacterium]